jgi:hypothetical protein
MKDKGSIMQMARHEHFQVSNSEFCFAFLNSQTASGAATPLSFLELFTDQGSCPDISDMMSCLYKGVGEWRCTDLPDEEYLNVLRLKQRRLEERYVESKRRKVKLWEIQEQLKTSE